MIKALCTLLVCLSTLSGFGQKKLPPLQFTQLADNIYLYVSYGSYHGQAYPANALYMVTPEGIVLFDTPWDSSYDQPLLDSLEARHHKKAILCVSTHFHTDRTGGLAYFASKGIKTYTTRQTDSLCIVHHDHRAEYFIPKDTTFHVGGYAFQTYYPGPGHTLDNIVIWLPQSRILYGGCFLKSVADKELGNLEDADVKAWGHSLHNLQQKFPDPALVIVGHNVWQDKTSIAHTLEMVSAYKATH